MHKQVGTVEILALRTYPLDGNSYESYTEVNVQPGTFPLYSDGLSYFWMMEGTLNMGRWQRKGDGMMIHTDADVMSDFDVKFPSKTFGKDEFAELIRSNVCKEGSIEQRLRITVNE